MLYNISFYDALVEMDKKVLIGGILLVSAIIMLYPAISGYLDAEDHINEYGTSTWLGQTYLMTRNS